MAPRFLSPNSSNYLATKRRKNTPHHLNHFPRAYRRLELFIRDFNLCAYDSELPIFGLIQFSTVTKSTGRNVSVTRLVKRRPKRTMAPTPR